MADSDDPFAPSEGTILRPRPGAGRRPAPGGGPVAPSPATRAPEPRSGQALAGVAANLTDFIAASRNPILQAAAPLLLLAARLGSSVPQASIAALRQQAVQEVRAFEERLRERGVVREDALVARYVLCTFVDAGVLNTPWGAQGDWAGQSLLVMFHKEVSGGEKFFEIIDRVRADPKRYVDLLELLYVCLALGYEGKFRPHPDGAARLTQLQHDLYGVIRQQRGWREEELSPEWKGIEDRRNPILQYLPWWLVAAAGLAILTVAFVVFHTKLAHQAAPIKAVLAATQAPSSAPSVPRSSRLKELLTAEERAGRLTVEELGDKTVVTLTAPNLFRSGSARVNPDLYPTLRQVALALNQVGGRIVIIGHTDDQPVRSLQYEDNFDLSRARALSVAQVLKLAIDAPNRLASRGAGSTQPRYQPVDTPENRARNRRVEIVHVPGSAAAAAPAPGSKP